MFASKRPQGSQGDPTGKIKLPKATARPTPAELKEIQQKADDNRNREIELQWSEPGSGKTYCLTIKWSFGPVEPMWTLLEDNGEGTNMVCQYATIEHELINDVVCMLDRKAGAGIGAEAVAAAMQADPGKKLDWPSVNPHAPRPVGPDAGGGQPQQGYAGGGGQPQQGYAGGGQPQQGYAGGGGQPQQGYAGGGGQPQQGYAGGGGQPQQGYAGGGQPQQGYSGSGQPQGYGAGGGAPAQSVPPPPTGFGGLSKPSLPPDPRGFSSVQPGQPARAGTYMPPPGGRIDTDSYAPQARPAASVEGNLEDMNAAKVMQEAAANRVTGKLEICGEETIGEIYYVDGVPKHAASAAAYGDGAIRELVTWEKGTYAFYTDQKTDMRSVEGNLEQVISEGLTMLDQKRHLKRAGLTYDSWLIRKHKQLSDSELKLMLTKGAPIDFAFQKKIFDYMRHKRRFTDLLRDHPMDSTMWTTVLFNFLSCGLIELKAPDAVQGGPLEFLGEAQAQVEIITATFLRPETGIYSFAAFLYFMEYEYNRFEAYTYPLSLIIFEVQRKREDGTGGTDLLIGQAANVAAQRINMIKRPLDTLGHFETLDYGLLLPNTTGASASWVANRIYESLTATPLIQDVDRNNLSLGFGIASLPADGDDLQSLVLAARDAKNKAKTGNFPIVMSRPSRR